MMSKFNRHHARNRMHKRVRRKISGTAERPRLAVYFSNKNVYAQLIDDTEGKTLASASTRDKAVSEAGSSVATATKIGEEIANRAKAAKIEQVVFDRGGFVYHGKVKALADAARGAGLGF
ncbi:MAG: 50S ribosomal protein L18 [Verrucomicrobiales bacterium]|nr:50S ribosomal protein L18 [Verrucomicrobiales bacterium]